MAVKVWCWDDPRPEGNIHTEMTEAEILAKFKLMYPADMEDAEIIMDVLITMWAYPKGVI